MEAIRLFKLLNRDQRKTFLACFLGWALDALDFFLLTFVLVPISREFGRSIPEVAFAITLTLMARPLGAFLFGLLGDKFGRRIPLMIDISVAIISTKVPILLGHGFWRFSLPKLASYGFWSMAHEARTDFCMLLGSLFLLVVDAGKKWSLDARLTREHTEGIG